MPNVLQKIITFLISDYGSCGQNIFVSRIQVDWMHVVKTWYMEHKNFTYGSSRNNLTDVGHYTQVRLDKRNFFFQHHFKT